jgi:hypothetical protein
VGPRRSGVAPCSLEHLLLKHRGNFLRNVTLESQQTMKENKLFKFIYLLS